MFIPRVFFEVPSEQIKDVIQDQEGLGVVEKIDLVERTDAFGKLYNMAYIHMRSWNSTERAQEFLRAINSGEKKVVYYDSENRRNGKGPYWTLLQNKLSQQAPVQAPMPELELLTPPRLVRNDVPHIPHLHRECSIGDNYDMFPGAPTKLKRSNTESRPTQLMRCNTEATYYNPLNLSNSFNEALTLVDADYAERLESEIATLNCVIDGLMHENAMLKNM
jgi:hypothetical protein